MYIIQNQSKKSHYSVLCFSVVDPDPGPGSVLDPYSIGPLDPDPDPYPDPGGQK
jgi:hypothetical protein